MKVKELIEELKGMDPEAEVQVQTWDGCAGPDDWFKNAWVDLGWDDKTVMLNVERGCMCVSRKDRLPLPEVVKENTAMKQAFFKLRKDAFLSRLNRTEVMEMAVKFVGNQPRD